MIYGMSAVVPCRAAPAGLFFLFFFFSGAATMRDPQRDCSVPHFNPSKKKKISRNHGDGKKKITNQQKK